MKNRTRRKYFARSAIVSELNTAAQELQKAIELAGKPPEESPLTESLAGVVKVLNRAIDNERIYQLGRKQIQKALVRERDNILNLLAQVKGVAISQGEKVLKAQGNKSVKK